MTKGTALRRTPFSTLMSSVIELHVKALFESCRKSLHWRVIRVEACVTDRAHGAVIFTDGLRNELAQMAAHTRFVAGKLQFTLFALALVA